MLCEKKKKETRPLLGCDRIAPVPDALTSAIQVSVQYVIRKACQGGYCARRHGARTHHVHSHLGLDAKPFRRLHLMYLCKHCDASEADCMY
jgi:hypothetical protein